MDTILENSLILQGNQIRYYVPQGSGRKGGGTRGKVKEFSRGARHRLMVLLSSLDYAALALLNWRMHFITLTTPPEYWSDELHCYESLRKFLDMLEKVYGVHATVIKKERGEKSGMLHYHIVTFGPSLKGCQKAFRRKWTKHLGYTKGEVIVDLSAETNDPKRISKYIAKYVTKVVYTNAPSVVPSSETRLHEASGEGGTGCASLSNAHNVDSETVEDEQSTKYGAYTGTRWWWVRGKEKLPLGEEIEIDLDDPRLVKRIANRVRRSFRRLRKAQQYKAIMKEYPSRPIADQMLKAWCKTYAFTFMKTGAGYMFMADSDVLDRLIMNAILQEECVQP